MSQMAWRELGSSPELGSSRNTIFDPPIKLFARHSFRLFPPDKFLASLPRSLSRAHSTMVWFTWTPDYELSACLMR